MPRKPRGATTAKIIRAARDLRHEMTPAETILWNAIRGRRLSGLKFRRQHPIGPFVLDLFCVEHQLAIEIDGGVHLTIHQIARDAERTQFLNEHRVHVLRFNNDEIEKQLASVLKRIVEAIRAASPLALF